MPRGKMIRVLAVRVGQQPAVEEIGDDLASFQAFVGGTIDSIGLGRNIAVVLNDDGVALGLPQNGCGLLGPYFFTRVEPPEHVSLKDEDIELCKGYWAQYRTLRHSLDTTWHARGYGSVEELEADRERERFDRDHAN